jgi:Fe-S-cluster containining protein
MSRLRLAIFGEPPCERCRANCCKQNGHEYAVLLEGQERRRFAAFSEEVVVRGEGGARVEQVLPYVEGRCQFLGADERCRIYEDRPVNCRRFDCLPGYHHRGGDVTSHGMFLVRNGDVRKMLDEL